MGTASPDELQKVLDGTDAPWSTRPTTAGRATDKVVQLPSTLKELAVLPPHARFWTSMKHPFAHVHGMSTELQEQLAALQSRVSATSW
jgi:hypothetical protein